MSFSYSPASTSILKGNDFYRVKARSIDQNSAGLETELGPGDLIPIDVGFSAIRVGPESDYENYELIYFDALGVIQVVPFSAKSPFVGSVPVDVSSPYAQGDGETKKAFIRIADSSTANGALLPSAGAGRIAVTIADIIVYTGAAPTFVPTQRIPNRRSANTTVLPLVPLFFYIPGYGREDLVVEASAMMIPDVDNAVTMAVDGLRVYHPFASNIADTITGTMLGKALIQTTVTNLFAATALPLTAPVAVPLTQEFPALSFGYNAKRASTGYFDFYRVTLRSNSTERPKDFYAGMGVHLSMEVRD
jgi:hypothetical protein